MSRLTIIVRKTRSFGAYPLATRLLIPIAIPLLAVARVVTLTLPFRYYASILGQRVEGAGDVIVSLSARERATARSIGRAVRASASVTPWRSVCLQQALVAALLLRIFRIAYISHLGVARGEAGEVSLRAHAWVIAGSTTVTGGGQVEEFTIVASLSHGLESQENPCLRG